jgi:hypothetical protein
VAYKKTSLVTAVLASEIKIVGGEMQKSGFLCELAVAVGKVSLLAAIGAIPAVPLLGQDIPLMTIPKACERMKTLLPLADKLNIRSPHIVKVEKITGAQMTSAGLTFSLGKRGDISFSYAEIQDVVLDSAPQWGGIESWVTLNVAGQGTYLLVFPKSAAGVPQAMYETLKYMAETASAGRKVDCTRDALGSATELDAFAQNTAAWRALTTKPEISEEVYKDRLLAEDAIKNRNLSGAATYYEAGVTSNPTWAQGWYDVALVYAELNDYFDAAQAMKHYVILSPDAQDVRAAKDNIIVWEAKSPPPTVSAPPPIRRQH